MLFIEELSLWNYITLYNKNEKVAYSKKSITLKLFSKFISLNKLEAKIEKCDFHLIEYTTDIRKNAYDNAFKFIENQDTKKWTNQIGNIFSIDADIIWKKYLFDELYNKYEFIEIAKKYKNDFPNENCKIYLNNNFTDIYKNNLEAFDSKLFNKKSNLIYFINGIILTPFILLYYYKNFKTKDTLKFSNSIVCLIDDSSTLRMFSETFSDFKNLSYVIEKHNLSYFTSTEINLYKLQVLGPNKETLLKFIKLYFKFIQITILNISKLYSFGYHSFEIFHLLMKGYSETIKGEKNVFVTYEHLITVKAARNEFLKANGIPSIFVPKNAYTATQYFHSELYINYTIMCAAGKHTLDLLAKKHAKTSIYLKAGSFDNHWGAIDKVNQTERLSKIKKFKGNNKLVTIISPGICDPTYMHEIKLMNLAKKIAKIPNTKVIIRTKPVKPVLKYSNFYDIHLENESNILLTNKEFELFDFLDDTNIFVTSISNAGSDIALAGGKILFINFMRDNDMFLFWRKIPSIVFSEETVFDKISQYLSINPKVEKNLIYESNIELVAYLGYRFNDFKEYKENLLNELAPYLPIKE